MSTTSPAATEQTITEFRVSPRKLLVTGMMFRTVRGSGPTQGGLPIAKHGEFRCLRLYLTGRGGCRTYCNAQNVRTGATHTLFLAGRPFTSPNGIRQRPFKIKLT